MVDEREMREIDEYCARKYGRGTRGYDACICYHLAENEEEEEECFFDDEYYDEPE